MAEPIDARIEGRLIALRQLLAMIAAGQGTAAILAATERGDENGEEDPGSVLDEAFALEAAVAEERRRIAAEIRLRMGR